MNGVATTRLDQAEACWVTALRRVRASDLNRTSGAAEWSNAELINHLIGGGVRYTKLLEQASTEEVEATRGADHLGEDMIESFWTYEGLFRALGAEGGYRPPRPVGEGVTHASVKGSRR